MFFKFSEVEDIDEVGKICIDLEVGFEVRLE